MIRVTNRASSCFSIIVVSAAILFCAAARLDCMKSDSCLCFSIVLFSCCTSPSLRSALRNASLYWLWSALWPDCRDLCSACSALSEASRPVVSAVYGWVLICC